MIASAQHSVISQRPYEPPQQRPALPQAASALVALARRALLVKQISRLVHPDHPARPEIRGFLQHWIHWHGVCF